MRLLASSAVLVLLSCSSIANSIDFSKAIKLSAIAIGMMEVPVIHGEYLRALQENQINDPLQLNFIRQMEGDSDSSSDSSSWDDSSSDSSSSDDSSHVTPKPSLSPTPMPSFFPSANPSVPPTNLPTLQPSHLPSMGPSEIEICDITVNPPLLLGSRDLVESPGSILLTGPRQALLPNDNRVITWSTVENGVGTFSWAAIVDSDNDIVISRFKVNDKFSFDPRVVALNDGNFIVTWQDNSGPQNIEGQIFQTDGTKIGDAFEITSDAWASQNDIVDQGNGFIASWRQTPGGFSPDPGILKAKLFSRYATVLNAYNISEFDTNGSYRASIASNDNNTVEFVWSSRDDNNIPTLYQKTLFLNNGFVSEAQVLSDPTHLGGPFSIAKLSNGNFVVVWGDGSHISAVILGAIP